jgi:lysophospholipase L1-like esterase
VHGVNAGVSSATIAIIATNVRAYLTELASYAFPPQTIIFALEAGANDLLTPGTAAALLPTVQSLCDDIRSAGFKVALHTCLARNSAGDGGTYFNAQRAIYNTAIRGWVGTHVDAIIDIAADSTIGTDAAANNTTYFNADKTHPLDAAYVIWETIARPVLDAL